MRFMSEDQARQFPQGTASTRFPASRFPAREGHEPTRFDRAFSSAVTAHAAVTVNATSQPSNAPSESQSFVAGVEGFHHSARCPKNAETEQAQHECPRCGQRQSRSGALLAQPRDNQPAARDPVMPRHIQPRRCCETLEMQTRFRAEDERAKRDGDGPASRKRS